MDKKLVVLLLAMMFVAIYVGCGGGSSGGGGATSETIISGVIEYSPTGNLSGIQVDAADKNNEANIFSAGTDANGAFSISVPNGTYSVVAKFNGGNLELSDEIVINGQSHNLGSVQCGAISGRVFLPDGNSPDTIFVRVPESRTAAWPDPATGEWALALIMIMTSQTQNFTVQYWESSGAYKSSTITVEVTKNKNTPLGDYYFSYAVGHILERHDVTVGATTYSPSGICNGSSGKLLLTCWGLTDKVVEFDLATSTFSLKSLSFTGQGFCGIAKTPSGSILISGWNGTWTTTVTEVSGDLTTVINSRVVSKYLSDIGYFNNLPIGVTREGTTVYYYNSAWKITSSHNLGFQGDGCFEGIWFCGSTVIEKITDWNTDPEISLDYPGAWLQGIAIDPDGYIWVADYNSRQLWKLTGE